MTWNEAIMTYTASDQSDQWSIYLGLAAVLLGFGSAYWLLRKPVSRERYNQQMLMALLLFMLGLLGLGTAFFSYWSYERTGEVRIYAEGIEMGNERIAFDEVKTIFFKEDRATNVFNAQAAARYRFLVIEPETGRPLVIPGEQFPIGEIKAKIGEQLKQ
jgi:hypothetical protein